MLPPQQLLVFSSNQLTQVGVTIQFLQQMLDTKESAEYLVKEVKQTKFLDQLYLDNTIDLEDYFKYSKR